MRLTSFFKAAIFAVIFCYAQFAVAIAQSSDSIGVYSLGVTEISAEKSFNETFNDHIEIQSSAWEGKSLTAAELLSTLPAIQSYKEGGVGSFQTISIRGISAKNILICIDGVPLNDASGGAVNLGAIDLNQVERIEVYKSNVPAKFGMQGLGGCINFVTKNATKKSGQILAAYGSHNTLEGAFQVAANVVDSINFSATFSARHSDNDYEYVNRNGTQYDDSDDYVTKRKNADYTDIFGNVQFRVLHSNGYFSTLSLTASMLFGGNPGKEEFQTKIAKFKGESATLRYELESKSYFSDALFLYGILSAKFDKNVSSSYYPLDHIGYSNSELLEYGAAIYKISPEFIAEISPIKRVKTFVRISPTLERAEARGIKSNWALDRFSFVLSGDIKYQIFKYISLGGEGNFVAINDNLSKETFVLPTGTRPLENASSQSPTFSGKGFIQLENSNVPFSSLFSIGKFYQEPALMELYGTFPGAISNPELKRESATKIEVSVSYKFPSKKTILNATYFESHLEDGISWVSSAGFMRAENIAKALVRGSEFELISSPVKFADIILRATFQKAIDKSSLNAYNNNKLSLEPAQSYFAEATLHFPLRIDFSWSSKYRSAIFSDRANKIRQPPVATHMASLAYSPFENTHLIFAINNITDEKYRNFYTPYPMPGREYKFTLIQGF